ncbi:MAG: DegQ family serine endoprotease [Deltaproteobacteria bacterium]|nr:DegQ family serine endoprotease [Deltaproteobacteria bacterium]
MAKPKNEQRVFTLRTIILVAIISTLVGIGVTIRLDITTEGLAQNFWAETKEKSNTKSKEAPQKLALSGGHLSFVELAKRLSPAVVNISMTQVVKRRRHGRSPGFNNPLEDFFGDEFKDFFGGGPGSPFGQDKEFKSQSLGSGFVINKDGHIVTNNHVIENATEIFVKFDDDKKEYKAKVIGRDPILDLALIKIESKEDLPVVPLGDSDALEIGQWVLAIGNPFGLGGTVTAGIISQKGRVIGAGPYDNFIQTDASINPGNSGGPLFNLDGEVIGVNTAIIAGGQGIGFAIPVNMLKDVVLQLKEDGKTTRGWIGVMIQEVTPEIAESFGLKNAEGALISAVTPGDPAERAGIKAGDIVIEFGGKKVKELRDLQRAVAATSLKKKTKIKVIRDGKQKTLFLKVVKRDDGTEEPEEEEEKEQEEEVKLDDILGLGIKTLTPRLAERYGFEKGTKGALVVDMDFKGLASAGGIKKGDVIIELNGKVVKSSDDFNRVIGKLKKNSLIRLRLQRGKNIFYLILKQSK